jgi:predicted MFS family arabinose efflux permease
VNDIASKHLRMRRAEQQDKVSSSVAHAPSRIYLWYAILLLTVVNVFNYMDRMALSVLAPLIKADLNLSDAQLGLLIGFAFSLFYAICGIPIARWADRGVRRNIIALALAVWSAMTALSGAAQNFWHLLAARVGVGAGEAGGLSPAQSMICDYVPPKKRSGIFALHNFGLVVGMMLGMVMAGWLGETLGWRWTFVVLGVPGLAFALIVRFTLREPTRGSMEEAPVEAKAQPSFVETCRMLWRCKTYRLLVLFLVANGFVHSGLFHWLPSFYPRVFGTSLSSVGISLGIAIGAGSGLGVLAGGFLANKTAQRDIRFPLTVTAAAIFLAFPVALTSLYVSSAFKSMLLVWVTALLWSTASGPVTASLYSVVQPQMRATAGAIYMFGSSAVGLGLGPLCVGLLSDLLTPLFGTEALRYALLAPVCMIPVMVIPLFAATRTLPHDLTAIGALAEEKRGVALVPNCTGRPADKPA